MNASANRNSAIVLLAVSAVALLVLWNLAPDWHASSTKSADILGRISPNTLARDTLRTLQLNWLDETRVVVKPQLDGWDAVANSYNLARTVPAFCTFALLLFFGVSIYALLSGELVGAVVSLIIGAVAVVVTPIYPFAVWLLLLVESGTANYYAVWFLVGIPSIFGGAAIVFLPLWIVSGLIAG